MAGKHRLLDQQISNRVPDADMVEGSASLPLKLSRQVEPSA